MTARNQRAAQERRSTVVADVDAKIADKRLKNFAAGQSTRRRTVLIRLNVPNARLIIGKRRKIGKASLPRRRLKLSDSQQKERDRKASQMMKKLHASGIESKRLNSGSIVAKVFPDQLREIAQSDMIKAIIPNRKYKVV